MPLCGVEQQQVWWEGTLRTSGDLCSVAISPVEWLPRTELLQSMVPRVSKGTMPQAYVQVTPCYYAPLWDKVRGNYVGCATCQALFSALHAQ